ncbi:hypothetical protein P152DRAFT_456664 [Eremomyces bilateralis CBS 781.70]|uniref:choline-phosphate cytidylyltransferase n=1 Tax=Eremomyces bilateralis CBS 781.70 TaxID=1392243 RepID=A0A6G1G8P5_9PEZI|nr:uncharacterized protein P152DRAFT_456664 [Eremomyces bilateralis CBS 781.70]KAF1814414.1 hypothetical protein P152DRAFT_456664 [Eremomyces bilateralis CBS 781.70]
MPPKRKRTPNGSSTDLTLDTTRSPLNDASGDDARESTSQNEDSSGSKSPEPAAKRSRPANGRADSTDSDLDVEEALEHGEGGERGKMRMEEPPRAGLVDPKGYHTNPPPEGRPVRVYADGVFDLFHLGHMRQLQQAKQAFPDVYLIVGVTGDKETHRRKGLTVLSGKERAESVRHCKWVDEVVEDCPWIITDTPEFIEKYQIDYVAHDDIPYGADEGDDIYSPIKEQGKFLVTQRTEGVSTTGIISKIIRDYDQYITRQLKRGTSRQELNVSWLKKNELDIKRTVAELRDNIRTNWTTTGQELGKELRQMWQANGSRPASPARSSRDEPNLSPRLSNVPSASAVAHLSHLDIPKSPTGTPSTNSSDFAAGYSLGLIGGVRSWMARSRRTLNDTRQSSPESGDEDSSRATSPKDMERGRRSSRLANGGADTE